MICIMMDIYVFFMRIYVPLFLKNLGFALTGASFLEYYGILWHIMAYYCILWHNMAYYGILWYIIVYYGIVWHIIAYYGILWRIIAY